MALPAIPSSLWAERPRASAALVERYRYLVKKTRQRIIPCCPRRIDPADLDQEGAIALTRAVEVYDPARRVKFESFAISCIRGRMLEFLRREDWAPRSVRTKQRRLRQAEEALLLAGGDAGDPALAAYLGTDLDGLLALRQEAQEREVQELDRLVYGGDFEDEGPGITLADHAAVSVPDEAEGAALRGAQVAALASGIRRLPDVEREVVTRYYLEGRTLKQVAAALGRSESRAHQLHTAGVVRLRDLVNGQASLWADDDAPTEGVSPMPAVEPASLPPVPEYPDTLPITPRCIATWQRWKDAAMDAGRRAVRDWAHLEDAECAALDRLAANLAALGAPGTWLLGFHPQSARPKWRPDLIETLTRGLAIHDAAGLARAVASSAPGLTPVQRSLLSAHLRGNLQEAPLATARRKEVPRMLPAAHRSRPAPLPPAAAPPEPVRKAAAPPLRLAEDLSLPLSAVTEAFGILSRRGAGKTHTASVLAEEMLSAGQQVIIVDPVGVWWGLRAGADGGAGLSVPLLGGDRGDAPLSREGGAALASALLAERSSAVLDLSNLRGLEQCAFVADFLETLYHEARAPLHLIVDEGDLFAPQRSVQGKQRALGAMEDVVRRGRARGIGVTLITQRPAVLHKDVLSQVGTLIALQTTSPQDRRAVEEWVEAHDMDGRRREFMSSLASLPVGTAWVWSPGADLFRRVAVRARRTWDSSRTPKPGEARREPAALAPVSIAAVMARIEAARAEAEEAAPRAERQRVLAACIAAGWKPGGFLWKETVEKVSGKTGASAHFVRMTLEMARVGRVEIPAMPAEHDAVEEPQEEGEMVTAEVTTNGNGRQAEDPAEQPAPRVNPGLAAYQAQMKAQADRNYARLVEEADRRGLDVAGDVSGAMKRELAACVGTSVSSITAYLGRLREERNLPAPRCAVRSQGAGATGHAAYVLRQKEAAEQRFRAFAALADELGVDLTRPTPALPVEELARRSGYSEATVVRMLSRLRGQRRVKVDPRAYSRKPAETALAPVPAPLTPVEPTPAVDPHLAQLVLEVAAGRGGELARLDPLTRLEVLQRAGSVLRVAVQV